MKRVALVGATSHLAKALIHQNSLGPEWELTLFARDPGKVSEFLDEAHITLDHQIFPTESLPDLAPGLDAIISCIGFGTPEKMRSAGISLFTVAEHFDNLILTYLERSPQTHYVNFSSGAVYGSALSCPVGPDFEAVIRVSPLEHAEFYRIAKLYCEAKHRALSQYSILDIRLFGFFSRFIDRDGGYLLTEILNSLVNRQAFRTGRGEIYRDYVGPHDLFQFVNLALERPFLNDALDIYSASPVSKSFLLQRLCERYGLIVEWGADSLSSPTGSKACYYTENKRAASILGYRPQYDALETICAELSSLGLEKATDDQRGGA